MAPAMPLSPLGLLADLTDRVQNRGVVPPEELSDLGK
jgi:hypothetical protein